MQSRWCWLLLSGVLVLALAVPSSAHEGDQVHIGRPDINVAQDEVAGDLVCVGCSIHMMGRCGDIVVIGGRLDINGTTKGDVVTIGGPLRLGESARIAGDVVTIGGRLWRDPNAEVRGTVSSRSGVLLFLFLVVIPLLPVILIVALIVWLVTRNRRPAVQARA